VSQFAIAMTGGGLALLLSLLLPFVIRPLLVRLGIMDIPSERSSHERPVLRGLGLAALIAILGGGSVAAALYAIGYPAFSGWRTLIVILVASLIAGLLGLGEDLKGVSVAVRSVGLLAIGVGSSAVLVWRPGGWSEDLPLVVKLLFVVYAVLFISSYTNVANFMDGLNGISGLHGVIAGLAFAAAGALSDLPWLLTAGLVLAAAFGGFLPWNLTKPGAFLGDVGAYLLGATTAVISFAALVTGVPILATIGPMIIYFGDVGPTLVKRMRKGHKWDEPHKEHVYQRLQQTGMSHLRASGITAGFTLFASLLGLASYFVAPIWWLALLVAGLALVVLYNLLPRLLEQRASAQE